MQQYSCLPNNSLQDIRHLYKIIWYGLGTYMKQQTSIHLSRIKTTEQDNVEPYYDSEIVKIHNIL